MEFEKVKKVIVDVLNYPEDEITMDSRFTDDLNADSLDSLEIIMGIEDEFDIHIDTDQIKDIETVGDVVEQIKKLTNE